MSKIQDVRMEIASLEKEIRVLSAERKDAIQGNMGFSFGYDSAVADLDRQIGMIRNRIALKMATLDEYPQLDSSPQIASSISPIQATTTSNLNASQRDVLQELDLLEQQLRANSHIWKASLQVEDNSLKDVQQQFEDARRKFVQFKNDKRFSFATSDLRREIDGCSAVVAIASAKLSFLKPILDAEWAREKAKVHAEQQEKERREQMQREQYAAEAQEQERVRQQREAIIYQRQAEEKAAQQKFEMTGAASSNVTPLSLYAAREALKDMESAYENNQIGASSFNDRLALLRVSAVNGENTASTESSNTAGPLAILGGLVGGFVGLFAGPVGVVIGAGIGAAIGGSDNGASEREQWAVLIARMDAHTEKLKYIR